MSDRARLEALRRGILALRVPLLAIGVLLIGWSIVGFVFSGMSLIIAVVGSTEGSRAGWWGLFGNGVTGSVTALLDLVLGAMLIGVSGLSMASRGVPARLVQAAVVLRYAWFALVVRLIGVSTSSLVLVAVAGFG